MTIVLKGVTINYRNIAYWGQQLLDRSAANVNLYGNVGIHSLDKTSTYPNLYSSTQENIVANDVTFKQNCNYFGETLAGNALEVDGQMTMEKGANALIKPHYWATPATQAYWFAPTVGIWLSKSSEDLNLAENAKLNIVCDNSALTTDTGGTELPSAASKNQIPIGIYSTGNNNFNLSSGSEINVSGDGDVNGNNNVALIKLGNLNLNLAEDAKFKTNINTDDNLSNGIINLSSKSSIDLKNNSTFDLSSISSDTSGSSYLFNTSGLSINLDRPKLFNLDNSGDSSKSKKISSATSNYIVANDVFTSMVGAGSSNQTLSMIPLPFKNISIPVNSSDNKNVKAQGSYTNTKGLYDYLNSVSTNGTSVIKMTKMDEPILGLNNKIVNDASNKVSGTVRDSDGNPIKNAYIKIYINNNSSDKYYFNDLDDPSNSNNIMDFLNMNTILYSYNNTDFSGNKFSGITNTNTFNNSMYTDTKGYFAQNTDSSFLKKSTITETYDGYDFTNPYVAKTDSNGAFSFKVPNQIWNDVQDNIKNLNVLSTYNLDKSNVEQVILNQPTQLDLDSSLKDISKNGDFAKDLIGVDQGDADSEGDTLEYSNDIKNTSERITYNKLRLSLPVPNSIDLGKDIYYSDDGGSNYIKLNSSDYEVSDGPNKTYKVLKSNEINGVKPGETKQIRIKFTLQNKNNYNNDKITFAPRLQLNNGTKDILGKSMSISFGGALSFVPEDLYYNASKSNQSGVVMYPNNDNHLAATIQDNRTVKTDGTVMLKQNNRTFNSTAGNDLFEGTLYLKDGSSYQNLYNNVVISEGALKNIYWSNNKQVVLIPDGNFASVGDYTNGDKSTEKTETTPGPGLSWTIKYGY